MFPLRDDNPQILVPYATYPVVALNVLAWMLLQGLGMEPQLSASVRRLGLIPGELLQTLPSDVRVMLGPNNSGTYFNYSNRLEKLASSSVPA